MKIESVFTFDEDLVVNAIKKYVYDNIRDIGKDNFINDITRLAISKIQETAKFEIKKPLNVVGE